ncbi:MAG: undecaprenyldiphospho-muramoylpentapeptide beta-N-acetylglucosaminyltransferase, partial [Mycoplasmatota bacterium]
GTHNRMEKDIIPKYNIDFKAIEIYGFNRKKLTKNIKTINCLIKSIKECTNIIKEFKPDIVIGVGGYVTTPVLLAAKKLKIKTFIHEQNSIPGKANLFLKNKVDKIGVSTQASLKYFKNAILTGNPCSQDAINIKAADKSEFNLNENKKLVLFVMGSLGSSKVNDFLIKTMNSFSKKEYEILFVTGKNSYDDIKTIKFPKNVKVLPYIENMTRIMKKTDIMVTRAGATTISEAISLKIPCIFIPSPYVPNNHQYINALDLVENNAALLIEEKHLKKDILVDSIDSLIYDESKIKEIKLNLKKLETPKSADKIYEIIKTLVKEG